MLTFLGTLVYQQRDIYGQGFGDADAKAVGVQTNTILTINAATDTPGHAKVYGQGVVVFAAVGPNPYPDDVISPFPDYSTTSIDGRGFQMDILNVDIRWFEAGDSFDFWDGIVYDAAAGTEAVVNLWHGDVQIVSGNLPQLGTN
jgi:hypothetical protein